MIVSQIRQLFFVKAVVSIVHFQWPFEVTMSSPFALEFAGKAKKKMERRPTKGGHILIALEVILKIGQSIER
jgi:hypothetical protein